jgi:hypothetical protein
MALLIRATGVAFVILAALAITAGWLLTFSHLPF